MTIERFIELWAANPESFMVTTYPDEGGYIYQGEVKRLTWDLEGPMAGVFIRGVMTRMHISHLMELKK